MSTSGKTRADKGRFNDEERAQFLALGGDSDVPLEELRGYFYKALREGTEHPYREALPARMQDLLTYLEGLPVLTYEIAAAEGKTFARGWLLYNAMLLGIVTDYYRATSIEA